LTRESSSTPPGQESDGIGEVVQSLQTIEARLNALETTLLDVQSTVPRNEVAELLQEMPRRLGEGIRAVLDGREDARVAAWTRRSHDCSMRSSPSTCRRTVRRVGCAEPQSASTPRR
jgi:hypothetical protein